jgi:hypothetical protein
MYHIARDMYTILSSSEDIDKLRDAYEKIGISSTTVVQRGPDDHLLKLAMDVLPIKVFHVHRQNPSAQSPAIRITPLRATTIELNQLQDATTASWIISHVQEAYLMDLVIYIEIPGMTSLPDAIKKCKHAGIDFESGHAHVLVFTGDNVQITNDDLKLLAEKQYYNTHAIYNIRCKNTLEQLDKDLVEKILGHVGLGTMRTAGLDELVEQHAFDTEHQYLANLGWVLASVLMKGPRI